MLITVSSFGERLRRVLTQRRLFFTRGFPLPYLVDARNQALSRAVHYSLCAISRQDNRERGALPDDRIHPDAAIVIIHN